MPDVFKARAAYDGARRRYLYDGYRPAAQDLRAAYQPRPSQPLEPFIAAAPSLATRAMRFARALGAGLRGIVAEFGPPRCSACRELIEVGDHYCARCGHWLGRTEKLRA